MTSWAHKSREERSLLNPAFCANLLWHAARGYCDIDGKALSFEESFLVLPFVLHRETRESLPRDTRTSLAVWLSDNSLSRGRVSNRARLLVGTTKEAITFGGIHGLLRIEHGCIHSDMAWEKSIKRALRASSDEVRECAKRAEFVGKWFALAGSAPTVLALIGVRP